MNSSKLITLLDNPALLDYKALSSKEALAVYEKALEKLLKNAKDNFVAILKTPETKISFKNVIEAYLNQDEKLGLLWLFLHHLNGTNASERSRKIIESFQPKMVEYGNLISLNPEYFALLKKVESSCEKLNAEQKRSLELLLRDMKSAGVHLKGNKKKRLEEINKQLAELSEKFSNNVLDSRKEFSYCFSSDKSFGEMPETDRHAAKKEAKNRKKEGWIFTLSSPSYLAIMQYCTDRKIRRRFWEENVRIASAGKFDNRPIIIQILALRKEKANLIGFDTYADYILEERMAESSKQVLSVLSAFAKKAKKKAMEEWKELEKFSGLPSLNYWDSAYFSEKLRKEKFSIDSNELKKYGVYIKETKIY